MKTIYLDYDDIYYYEYRNLHNVGLVPVLFRHISNYGDRGINNDTRDIIIHKDSFLLVSRYVTRFREFLWDIDSIIYKINHHPSTGHFYFEVI
jgi:hypothetical protein